MAINKVFLVGNVTADCKVHERDGETNCITFGIAVDERRYNKETEEWDSVPNFFNCAVFGKRAAGLKDSIKKGIRVAISGHLRYSTYGEGDEKRSSVSIVVDDLDFMSAKQQARKGKTSKQYTEDELPFRL